jgi:hypothetical protein
MSAGVVHLPATSIIAGSSLTTIGGNYTASPEAMTALLSSSMVTWSPGHLGGDKQSNENEMWDFKLFVRPS